MIKPLLAFTLLSACLCASQLLAADNKPAAVEPWRVQLSKDWKALPLPPITPYSGPFGFYTRAFYGDLPKGQSPWALMATPEKDPRAINTDFEAAILDDWRSMGYNTAYKQGFYSGRWLKQHGMLGAIDQTLWADNSGRGPMNYDGTYVRRQSEGSGSFFAHDNFEAGVRKLSDMVTKYGDLDMVKVGDRYITSSWDEVGMRESLWFDYRPEAIVEYRKYLKDIWFQDASPDKDTNHDGRTYNSFTGEQLKSWEEVQPPVLSSNFASYPKPMDEKWSRLGSYKLWMDFRRYFTFEFFRRTNAEATARSGKNVECYPFPQAFIMWPGIDGFWGMSVYWNARLNPILNVEQCWPDSPAMPLNYAVNDRLARQQKNLVMGWSWFWFGKGPSADGTPTSEDYTGPYDIGRALARMMSHRVDGIHHWLYSPHYRLHYPQQRRQLAYWQNFLGKHYRTFLAKSEPVLPEVALLMPDWTGYFYRLWYYPKGDWSYTAEGLQEAQIPYEMVTEEELELNPDTLKQYKVLYVVAGEWTTPAIRRRIEKFIAGGGVVCADVDSLSLDIPTGQRTDFLEKTFGVKIEHKYKNSFMPSTQSAEEEAWGVEANGCASLQNHNVQKPGVYSQLWKNANGKAVPDNEAWTKLDAVMAKMPKIVRGLEQSALDMRQPPKVRYADGVGPVNETTTWSEVDTAKVLRGKPIAWYGGKVCGVETAKTVWLGTREGMSLHAISPRMEMNRTTEPCNPYVTEAPDDYAPHKPYVDVIAYAARKAGVKRPVTVTLKGQTPYNLEVNARADAEGNLMVFVINHDKTDATYQVAVDPSRVPKAALAWNLLENKLIAKPTNGVFDLPVAPEKVAVFLICTETALKPVQAAQAELMAMDLSVPKYFLDHPEVNADGCNTLIPPMKVQ